MSCGCTPKLVAVRAYCGPGAPVCDPSDQALDCSLDDMIVLLFGDGSCAPFLTRTCLPNGQVKYTPQYICGFPPLPGEGLFYYYLRFLASGQFIRSLGNYDVNETYCPNTMVVYNGQAWSNPLGQANPGQIPGIDLIWVSGILNAQFGLDGNNGNDGENALAVGA